MKKIPGRILIALSTISTFLLSIHMFNRFTAKKAQKPRDLAHMFTDYYDFVFGKIRYSVLGTGTPLLLIHGIGAGCSYLEWEETAVSLSKHYRVYAIDLVGFGASGKPNMVYSAYLFARIIEDFTKDIIGQATNIAASGESGAFSVLACTFSPENFEKMMLINPIGANIVLPTKKDALLLKIIRLPIIGTFIYNVICTRIYTNKFLKNNCFSDQSHVSKEMVNQYVNAAHYGGENSKHSVASFIASYLNVDLCAHLKDINIPVHIVWGADCEMPPATDLKKLKQANNSITATIMSNTKRLPHVERPTEFIEVCRKFFG